MMNVIKTAIVTIIISIISGLLVERFKSFGPRILCDVGERTSVKVNNKMVYAYVITVSNLSKKIIHRLTLNIQSPKCSLKIADAKITKGLKFESSSKDNSLDIDIPFLSSRDKFSVTVYVENQYGVYNKPAVVMRSPENFKKVDSEDKIGILTYLFNTRKNESKPTSNMDKPWQAEKTINRESAQGSQGNNKLRKNKKIIMIAASVLLVVLVGVLGVILLTENQDNSQTGNAKASTQNQSNNSASTNSAATSTGTSTQGLTKNAGTNAKSSGESKSTSTNPSSQGGTTSTGTSTQQSGSSTVNSDSKASSTETTKDANSNTTTKESTDSSGTNASTSTGSAGGSSETNTSTAGSTSNTSK